MASLIKNQILKHLSKFTKNLSPDKIHLSTLKGEGEMSNLELDEVVLMELLDLPTWLRLSSATCNKVAIKIQWTKLKAQPICLYLDEIVVEMETCDVPRQPSLSSNLSSYSSGGKYGFAERIIDGMFVSINSVIVNFRAPTFQASIQISRIIIQSKTPLWQSGDLRLTRVKDELRGEILIFKEAEWQTLRIEANALDGSDPSLTTTPLRLIANQSKTRITIKKRLNDCGLIASRVQFNLDDLLWVLTDSQLKAAIVFANSLKEVIQKSTQQAKLRATDKIKAQGPPTPSQQSRQQQSSQRSGSKAQNALSKLFNRYDVVETSYHLYTGRVDLHLCEDTAPAENFDNEEQTDPLPDPGGQRRRVEGGAMQVTVHKMSLDHYPFHHAGSERTHWLKHDENMMARNAWAQDLLNVFREEVRRVRETMSTPPPSPGPGYRSAHQQPPPRGQSSKSQKPQIPKINTKLLESCMVLRVEDFTLYRVSTARDNKRNSPKKFLTSDKKQLLLPQDMSSIHLEYTDYYFPEGVNFPVPHANLFVMLNPLRLNLDWVTLVWLNAFSLNLLQTLAPLRSYLLKMGVKDLVPPILEAVTGLPRSELPEPDALRIHTDIKIDALMPRIILPAEVAVKGQADRPDGLQIQASRLTFTNSHIEHKASLAELGSLLQGYENSTFFSSARSDFPKRMEDLSPLPDMFRRHVLKDNDAYLDSSIGDIVLGRRIPTQEPVPILTRANDGNTYYSMNTDSLKLNANKDIWCLAVDQFWMEFVGVPSAHNRPVPFVESFPLTVWMASPLVAGRCAPPLGSGSDGQPRTHRQLERTGSNPSLKQYYGIDGERVPQNYINGEMMSHSRESSPTPGRLRRMSIEKPYGDLHMLVKMGAKVNIQLSHYQYVFLMRLLETVSKFSQDMKEDTAFIMQETPPEKSIVLAVKLRELELALICPPIPEMPGGLGVGSREDSDDLKMLDDLPEDATRIPHNQRNSADDSALGGSILESRPQSQSLQAPVPILKSHSDTELTGQDQSYGHSGSPSAHLGGYGYHTDGSRDGHPAGESYPRIQISDGSVSMSMGSTSDLSGSSPQHRTKTWSTENLTYDSSDRDKKGEIRKSFNNAFSNLSKLTEKVKQNVKALDVMDDGDDWDALSIKSGESDDDEYVFLRLQNAQEEPAFQRHHSSSESVSVADSDGKEESGSFNTYSGMSERARGVVSVVAFRLINTEAIIQMKGDDLSVGAQVYHLVPNEYGNINLDKFHQKFSYGNKEPDEKYVAIGEAPIKLRYQVGPAAERFAVESGKLGHLRAMVHGLQIKLNMSSVTNLVDLIEDEVIPPAMPMLITASDCTFTLQNDAPPTHMTSPEPVPLDFYVDRLTLTRANDGVFRIIAGPPMELEPVREPTERPRSMPPSTPPGVRQDNRPGTPPGVRSQEGRPSTPPGMRSHDPRPLQEAMRQIKMQADSLDRVKRENMALRDRIVQVEEELDHKLSHEQMARDSFADLQEENDMLRRQLEKIATMDSGVYQQEAIQREMNHWREQAQAAEAAQRENAHLLQQLTQQQDEIHILKQERDSLLATLQLLQEELTASESMRARTSSTLS